jgi:DNA-directed RNA polymerase subunit RPC12/RpoP
MRVNPRALECSKCGRWVENIGEDTVKVVCPYCVLQAVGMPKEKKSYTPTGRPAGWHWMAEFVDKDGNVFHRGKEQPKLKGTLPPTKVTKTKVKTKRRTQQQILLDRAKEKKAALRKAVQKQKDFINHNIDKG